MITLSLLHRLLHVDESEGVNALVQASYQVSYHLPTLVVSVAALEDVPVGSGSGDMLRRAQLRAEDYAQLYAALTTRTRVRRLKGQELADRYPAGIMRPTGDLDLVAVDAADVWQAAMVIVEQRPVSGVDLALFGAPEQHLLLHFEWSPVDEILDPPARVDLCTAAYAERLGVLPVRADLPGDPWLASFLAIAEERFQRLFNARDLVDVRVLSGCVPPVDDVVSAACSWDLVPEATELLALARDYFTLGPLEKVYEALRYQVDEERFYHERETAPSDYHPSDPGERMRRGLPVHAALLGRPVVRADQSSLELHHFDQGVLALTPLGPYLLGHGASDPSLRRAALAEVKRIGLHVGGEEA